MMLYVRLRSADSLALPSGLGATRAWAVDGSHVWETELQRDPAWTPACSAGFYASYGPRWGPNIYVDVTVRVDREGGSTWYVRIPRCLIEMAMWNTPGPDNLGEFRGHTLIGFRGQSSAGISEFLVPGYRSMVGRSLPQSFRSSLLREWPYHAVH